jgi:rod shape determining protein RodA
VFERRLYHHIDWALLTAIVALCSLGVAMVFSTTSDPTRGNSHLYITQLYAIGLGMLAMVVTLTLDYRTFTDKSHLIYIGLLAILLYVLFLGTVQMGARRWIPIGGFNLQPSEFAKVGVALVLAKYFGENRGMPTWTDLAIAGGLTCLPLALIAREPDLGTAVTLIPGVPRYRVSRGHADAHLGYMALSLVLLAPVAWKFALKDYQKSRISTFIDPSQDARGAGYQQIQARITVGSGGLTGKGYMQGTQGQLRFPPRGPQRFHFLGAGRGTGVCRRHRGARPVFVRDSARARGGPARPRIASAPISCSACWPAFTFQVIYNITMSAGLAPVKGLTLPLMSYGGSSMIATLAGFGLVLNVRMRRFTN